MSWKLTEEAGLGFGLAPNEAPGICFGAAEADQGADDEPAFEELGVDGARRRKSPKDDPFVLEGRDVSNPCSVMP